MNGQFTFTLDCDNAAFDGKPAMEIARIMRTLANQLQDTDVLYGREGNTVGTWHFIVDGTNEQAVRS